MNRCTVFCLLLLLLGYREPVKAQPDLSSYIELKAGLFEEEGEKYLDFSPRIKASAGDHLSQQLIRYHRRFDYLLKNRTRFQNRYDSLYPDTARIDALYLASLQADTAFRGYWMAMTNPFLSGSMKKERYSMEELMQTASVFFYCNGIRNDSSVSSHICIVLNGTAGLKQDRDRTLLEAFCFEAIFSGYDQTGGNRPKYVENFLQYIRNAEQQEKGFLPDRDTYLLRVRQSCFAAMQQDPDLRQALLDYYAAHRDTFSFIIE